MLLPAAAPAQVGPRLWSDEMDDLSNWILVEGNGSWGWGNGELQYCRAQNVDIAPVPGEPGNQAMRITARQESGPGIVDQWGHPLQYTSGRADTKSMVSVRYGMVEARLRVPSLELGGWPALWMLGTSNLAWPRSGEMDLMEMGSRQAFRDLHDTHDGGSGTDEPVRPYYDQVNGLVDRFLMYRLYWDDSSLRFTVVDGGVEHDLYVAPFAIDAESAEFTEPFYLLANLAVGGAFTDAYNLGDPGSGQPVSMGLPAEMYLDYIRVYEWNGQGEVPLGPPAFEAGRFGLFTDNTPVQGGITPGVDGDI